MSTQTRFKPETLVSWECRATGEKLVGVVIKQLEKSAIVRVTNVETDKLERHKLGNDMTNVAFKRLSVHKYGI